MSVPFESSSDSEAELPISARDISEYAKAVEDFDAVRGEVLGSLCDFIEDKTEEHNDDLTLCSAELVRQFGICIAEVHEQNDDQDEEVSVVLQLLVEEQNERISLLNTLLPDIDFDEYIYDDDYIKYTLEEIYESNGSIGEVKNDLLNLFSNDLEECLEYIRHYVGGEELGESIAKETFRKELGKHALDIAKISIGVASGLLISKLFTKKNS